MKSKKYYGVYLAYHKREILPDELLHNDPSIPNYPRGIAKVRIYDNLSNQLDAYSNIACPASQCFEADSMDEIKSIVNNFNNKFEDEQWLEENIYPYI